MTKVCADCGSQRRKEFFGGMVDICDDCASPEYVEEMKCNIHKLDYCTGLANGEHCCPDCKTVLLNMLGFIVSQPYTLLEDKQ